jgi:hypothetical protein
MSTIIKICKIHGNLTLENVYKRPNYLQCKECLKKYKKEYKKKVTLILPKGIVKICKIHGQLTRKEVQINRSYFKCAMCCNFTSKEYYRKNKEMVLKRNIKYNKNNSLKVKKLQKDWREKNIKRVREKNKLRLKNGRENLLDSYIKHLIVDKNKILGFRDITPEIIEVKRLQVKIKRKLKEQKDDNKEC